jgi:formylglycine-generating enzyme required for sulfatase activity
MEQDFDSPVTYTVTAEDDSTQDYTVTVTVELNWAKAITAFNFASPSATGTINEASHTIAVTVPYGTAVTALVPTITHTGASVNPASGFAQNFTNPVIYTVTAENASTQNYTVTVTVAPAVFVISGTGGTAGNNQSFTYGTLSFNMKYVPGGTFPTGTGNQTLPTDSGANPATVSTPYWMAETEVTYELWYAVRTWARANGYTLNANPGREGNDGIITPGAGAVPTAAKQEPVTTINWREAMVWCNALTEYYNANNGTDSNLDCVYYTDSGYTTPIRSADDTGSVSYPNPGGQDDPYVKSTAKGFRLPGSMEWECAARYKDGTNWTAGSWASGGTGAYTGTAATDYPNFNPFAWYGGTTTYPNGNTTTTQPVAGKTANLLGIRDMSGNVSEWCLDWYPSYVGSARVIRGGSWGSYADYLRVGGVRNYDPYYENLYIGFRFVRTITYAIGDTGPGGGIVFYITNGSLNGLEAAPPLWNGGSADPWSLWSNIQHTAVGVSAQGTAIGTGLANSNAIIAQSGHTTSAAKLCRDYTGGGKTDWFLPSKDELNQLYLQKAGVGGFAVYDYWSSSEYDANLAWFQIFSNGDQYLFSKTYSIYVRPVRAF